MRARPGPGYAGRGAGAPGPKIAVGGLAVVVAGVLTLLALDAAGTGLARVGAASRFAAFVIILGPVSFAMGWLFPAAVSWLDDRGVAFFREKR